MRRLVRSPVPAATPAAISSSVCKLPFIRTSVLPAFTCSHGFGRGGTRVRHVVDLETGDVQSRFLSDLNDLFSRADKRGRDQTGTGRLHCACQTPWLTRENHGCRERLERAAPLEQIVVRVPWSLSGEVRAVVMTGFCMISRSRSCRAPKADPHGDVRPLRSVAFRRRFPGEREVQTRACRSRPALRKSDMRMTCGGLLQCCGPRPTPSLRLPSRS